MVLKSCKLHFFETSYFQTRRLLSVKVQECLSVWNHLPSCRNRNLHHLQPLLIYLVPSQSRAIKPTSRKFPQCLPLFCSIFFSWNRNRNRNKNKNLVCKRKGNHIETPIIPYKNCLTLMFFFFGNHHHVIIPSPKMVHHFCTSSGGSSQLAAQLEEALKSRSPRSKRRRPWLFCAQGGLGICWFQLQFLVFI